MHFISQTVASSSLCSRTVQTDWLIGKVGQSLISGLGMHNNGGNLRGQLLVESRCHVSRKEVTFSPVTILKHRVGVL